MVPRQAQFSSVEVIGQQSNERSPEELIATAGSAEERISIVRKLNPALHEPVLLAIAGDTNLDTSVRYAAITLGLSRLEIVSTDWVLIAMRTDILMLAAPMIAKMGVPNARNLYMIAKDARLDNTRALAIGRLGYLRLHDQLHELSLKLDNPRLLQQIQRVLGGTPRGAGIGSPVINTKGHRFL